MCHLVFFVRDRANPDDVFKDARLYKAGDVIESLPDRWNFGSQDLANPDWRILFVPDMTVEEGHQFTGQEFNVSSKNPTDMLRRRRVRIDLAALGATSLAEWLADDSRKEPIASIDAATLMGAKRIKEPITDPRIIGELATDVIG